MVNKRIGMVLGVVVLALSLALSMDNIVRSSTRPLLASAQSSPLVAPIEDVLWSCTRTTDSIAGTESHPTEATVEWFFNSKLKLFTESWIATGESINTFSYKYKLVPGQSVQILNPDGSTYLEASWVISSSGTLTVTRTSPAPPTGSVTPHTLEGYDPSTGQTLGSVTFPAQTYEAPSVWEFKQLM